MGTLPHILRHTSMNKHTDYLFILLVNTHRLISNILCLTDTTETLLPPHITTKVYYPQNKDPTRSLDTPPNEGFNRRLSVKRTVRSCCKRSLRHLRTENRGPLSVSVGLRPHYSPTYNIRCPGPHRRQSCQHDGPRVRPRVVISYLLHWHPNERRDAYESVQREKGWGSEPLDLPCTQTDRREGFVKFRDGFYKITLSPPPNLVTGIVGTQRFDSIRLVINVGSIDDKHFVSLRTGVSLYTTLS